MTEIFIAHQLEQRIREQAKIINERGRISCTAEGTVRDLALLLPEPHALSALLEAEGWKMDDRGTVKWASGPFYVSVLHDPDRSFYIIAYGDSNDGGTFYRSTADVAMRLARNMRVTLADS